MASLVLLVRSESFRIGPAASSRTRIFLGISFFARDLFLRFCFHVCLHDTLLVQVDSINSKSIGVVLFVCARGVYVELIVLLRTSN